ncbi:MAG: transaldolase [Phycisphaerae bacterium]
MNLRIGQISALGQSIWCDSISRSLIDSGRLSSLIDDGVVGMTSNPTIFHKAISGSSDYDGAIEKLVAAGKDAPGVYEALTVTDVRDAADLLRPVFDRTDGVDGRVSLEVNPHLAHDTQGTVAEARHLFNTLDRPNILIKVPATEEGIGAIETLISEGVSVNVTLIFSLEMYAKVMEAYIRGLESLRKPTDSNPCSSGEVSGVVSVASFFVSRIDTLVDKKLTKLMDEDPSPERQRRVSPLLGKAAVGNAKLAYQRYKAVFHGERFAKMRRQGARVQRPLWASTSTKNPAYSDTLYVDTLIGPETVNTLPLATIDAVKDHATPALTIEKDLNEYRESMEGIEAGGVSMDEVTGELIAAGVKSFADSFDLLMSDIEAKVARETHGFESVGFQG